MQFLIGGKVYFGIVKRVRGKLKIFFDTYDSYYIVNGFDLPDFCCSRMKCKWKIFRDWKLDLVNNRIKDTVIYQK
jgi:hypothetical protein